MALKIAPIPDELVRGADHPLIVATVNTLPLAGAPFPAAQRKATLAMIEMAFNVIYGGELGGGMGDAVALATPAPKPQLEAVKARRPHEQNGCDYYVDEQGFARCDVRRDGPAVYQTPQRRVTADEADGHEIYEYRGARRDRDTVIWADESQGALPGMNFCGPGGPVAD